MLEQVRRASRSGLSYVMVAALIVIFMVFFGVPTDSCSSAGPQGRALVAEVGDTEIHTDDVNIIFNRVYGTRNRGSEDQIRQQQAKSFRALLLIHLMADRAREAGLRVGEEEFREFMQDPTRNLEYRFVYGKDGTWDGSLYKMYVQNQLRVPLPEYESYKKNELLARKYLSMLDMQVGTLPGELQELHKLRNTKANLAFVKFNEDELKKFVDFSDDELQAYIDAHTEKLKKHYEANKSDYETDAQVRVRRIFIPRPDESADGELQKAQQKFAAAKKRVLEDNEDFGAVASELTEDFTKKNAGLMSWTKLENLDENILTAVKDAKEGDVNEVETDYAFMLVKLEGRKEAQTTPFEEVRAEIARTMLSDDKIDSIVTEMTDRLKAEAKRTGSLEKALASIQAAEQVPAKAEQAADSEQTGDGETADTDADSAEKPSSPWASLQVKKTGEFSLEGQSGLAAMLGPQFAQFASWDRIPSLGRSKQLVLDTFNKLSTENPISEKTYELSDGKVIVELVEKTKADDKIAPEDEAKLQAELRMKKVRQVLGDWSKIFAIPSEDYGAWLEGVYKEAVDSGTIKLYENRRDFVAMVTPEAIESRNSAMPINMGAGGQKTIQIPPAGGQGKAKPKGPTKNIEIPAPAPNGKAGESGGGE